MCPGFCKIYASVKQRMNICKVEVLCDTAITSFQKSGFLYGKKIKLFSGVKQTWKTEENQR